MKEMPLRLQPGVDLHRALEAWMGEQLEQAVCVISAVGSLSLAQLRFAGAAETTAIRGELEIKTQSEW
jgi:predicted DNA-binding protein with PD1-like motif